MALLIRGGEIVTDTRRFVADIFCEGETISKIGTDLPSPAGATVVDAKGKFLGVVSLHDIKPYLSEPALGELILAGDILHEDFPRVAPGQPRADMAAVAQNAEIVEQHGRGRDLKPERLFAALHKAAS